jgi:poly(3-hydroxybutyrate) depolymerase
MPSQSAKVRDPQRFYETGATTIFASRHDQRFSYCLYVPKAHLDLARGPLPLVVLMHGTGRTGPQYRDAFANFAEKNGCVILAPLFPAGIVEPGELHNYKYIRYQGIRFDDELLHIVDEVGEKFRVDADRFLMFGYSGGGQFTHRFLYLRPERLAAASIGAPGRVTLLDTSADWWHGTRDMRELFGRAPDVAEMCKVPVQLVVGADDIETWEIGEHVTGNTRVERLTTLFHNLQAHGLQVRLDLVPGVAHRGFGVLDTVQDYFAHILTATRSTK